MIMRDVI